MHLLQSPNFRRKVVRMTLQRRTLKQMQVLLILLPIYVLAVVSNSLTERRLKTPRRWLPVRKPALIVEEKGAPSVRRKIRLL